GLPPFAVTVVDATAYPVAFARMDDRFLGAIDGAYRKARTAALFRADSVEVGANFQPGGPAYALENTNGGLIGVGGGVLLRDAQGRVLGAIGVSGASAEQDQAIAEAAARHASAGAGKTVDQENAT
ncbi:heme-binding protein, partial [Burkholderia sp. Ap-962]|uniref:GlcG/HbpS family heme-binding protein n=1 Tax=Burkholderia sp. Ap-962 TaxID=2608333 RepID=UPI001420CC9D